MNKHIEILLQAYLALPAECRVAFDTIMKAGSEPAAPLLPETMAMETVWTGAVAQPVTARIIAQGIDAVRKYKRPVEPATSPDNGRLAPLGGHGLNLSVTDRFLEARFRDRWCPGHAMGVYVAGCRGTTALAGRLGRPIFKVGVHEGPDAGPRLKDLGLGRYGSARLEDGELIMEAGFESWTAEPVAPKQQMAPGSPVGFGLEGLAVTCPADMSPAGFDQALARALSADSLETFIWSRGGQGWCKRRGIDPATLLRYSPVTDRGRVASASKELTFVRPKFDAMRLVRIAENIVYDHVIGGSWANGELDGHRGDTPPRRIRPAQRRRTPLAAD